MQISPDKVFTPPKHVTQNLEKKEIVRKAKVVSAINADDRSAAFDGSKRVRYILVYTGTTCTYIIMSV